MASNHTDIALLLLNSHDEKVAAAARRIFSPGLDNMQSSPPKEQQEEKSEFSTQNTKEVTAVNSLKEIEDAARSVVALDTIKPINTTSSPQMIVNDESSCTVNEGTALTMLAMAQTTNTISESDNSVSAITTVTSNACSNANDRKSSPHERLQRSRERNKIHARRTRQRKKEHMQDLENRASELKKKQIGFKQQINEKNTINILLAFSAKASDPNAGSSNEIDSGTSDSKVEELLKRPNEDIPDASKIPELPALVLPGHHNNRKRALDIDSSLQKTTDSNSNTATTTKIDIVAQIYPNDGIDYELLAKDRSTCTPAELDKIRRERNRMHAKRTRDRKKRFTEEMETIIKKLEEENTILESHLNAISSKCQPSTTPHTSSTLSLNKGGGETPSLASPVLEPLQQTTSSSILSLNAEGTLDPSRNKSYEECQPGIITSQPPPRKRQCFDESINTNVPKSITTTNHSPAAIGC